MVFRFRRVSFVLSIMAMAGLMSHSLAQEGTRSVTTKGESAESYEEAEREALRRAVEEAGQVHIGSWSEVENAVLVHDVIKTRVDGLVRKHEVLKKEKGEGTYIVTIRAEVNPATLDAIWADVKHLMEQMGEPKIMLFCDGAKQMIGQPEPTPFQRFSPVVSAMQKVLKDCGFRVIEESRFKLAKEAGVEALHEDKLVELMKNKARDRGAQIYIDVWALAEGPTEKPGPQGLRLYEWQTTVTPKAIWSDSGEILAQPDLFQQEKNFSDPGESELIKLFEHTAKKVAVDLRNEVVAELGRIAIEGRFVNVNITSLAPNRRDAVEEKIKSIEDVKITDDQVLEESVSFEVKTKLLPRTLRKAIEALDCKGFKLVLHEARDNTMTFIVKEL